MAMNKYPVWKNLLILVVVLIGTLYSLPNLFGEDFALQISTKNGRELTEQEFMGFKQDIESLLTEKKVKFKSLDQQKTGLLVRLEDAEEQLLARTWVKSKLGEDYIIALNLAPATPSWLRAIGAEPMKLGLDLRGGVHFLMEVDTNTVITRNLESDVEEIRKQLREEKIRYRGVTLRTTSETEDKYLSVRFKSKEDLTAAKDFLQTRFPHLQLLLHLIH